MAIDGVVAEVGLPADKPARERRARRVAGLLERALPVDEPGLLGPEALAVLERAAVELAVRRHATFPAVTLLSFQHRADLVDRQLDLDPPERGLQERQQAPQHLVGGVAEPDGVHQLPRPSWP